MIRSSIISVGRNPMSQSAVHRDLIQLSALVLGILAVGFTALYLVLTRLWHMNDVALQIFLLINVFIIGQV